MDHPVPATLRIPVNEKVLALVNGWYAHADVAEALGQAVAQLGDVQTFCPNPASHRYVLVSTRGVIFGFASGTSNIAFRLDPLFETRAVITGARHMPEVGPEWASFTLFQNDWPAPDVAFWARKAYAFAREGE